MLKSIRLGFAQNTVLMILIILTSLFHLTPLLYENYKIIIVLLWLLSICYFLVSNKRKASPKLKVMLLWGVGYIAIGFLYSILGISSGKIVRDMLFSLFLFPIMFLVLMDTKLSSHNVKLLFHVIAFIVALNILDNIRLSYLYPYIALMSQEVLEEQGLTGLNAGGAPFIAMAVFYLAIVMTAFFSSTEKYEKILFLLYAFIAFWFIVFCSFKASNAIYAMLTVAVMLLLDRIRKINTAIIILLISGFFLLLFLDPILHLIVDIIDNQRVGTRLLVFADEDIDSANANSINSRMDLWLVSLHTWIDNPVNFVLGIGEHSRHDYIMGTAESGVGNHSEFFDILAKYGILGGVILYNILKKLFDFSKQMVSGRLYLKVLIFFALIILFGFTKKIILPSISIMFFILFPLCLYKITSKKV